MIEQDRLLILNRINKILEQNKEREEKKDRIKQLEQSDIVKEYLKLLIQVKELDAKLFSFKSEQQIALLEFNHALKTKIKSEGITLCEHEIWMYAGTYNSLSNGYYKYANQHLTHDESDKDFYYNKYSCLECGKIITVEKWQEFEQTHTVLKDRDELNTEKYTEIYYQLLYTHRVEEAQKMLIEEFNNNKCKKKIRTK